MRDLVSECRSQHSENSKANCFNAVQIFWKDTGVQEFVGPEKFVRYISGNFSQLGEGSKLGEGDVVIVWSRSSFVLPVGKIKFENLIRKAEGYPFCLIIQHAFVQLTENQIFQKRDPTDKGPYEIIQREEALKPYRELDGYELTAHRRNSIHD